nr:reverse transcriptase, RNA-dependent DNA polymerase, Gag-polypeptide of LTR copia-type [Tanacetum cinerariifolium]
MTNNTDSNSSNPNSTRTTDDINSSTHQLHFHPQDHLGMILISRMLTGLENYSVSNRSMMIALSARNKFKLVNGVICGNYYKEGHTKEECYELARRVNGRIKCNLTGHVYRAKAQEIPSPARERNKSINTQLSTMKVCVGMGMGAVGKDGSGIEEVVWCDDVASGEGVTEYQLADMFTKALPEDKFKYLVGRIGMRYLTPAELEVLEKESS